MMSHQNESVLVDKISSWLDANSVCKSPDGPVLTTTVERRESILANTEGAFIVDENPDAKIAPKPWYEVDIAEEVTANAATIERRSREYRLDPDFVKAIVWMESTHGWYDRVDPWNKTIRPMNVHASLWSELGITRKDLNDPAINIPAGLYILAGIRDRTVEPTNEKVATLYNQMGATKVNSYGKTVAYYALHKPWIHKMKVKLPTVRTSCPSGIHYGL